MQAYEDDLPFYHKMENNSPQARYAVFNIDRKLTHEIVSVEYDFESAAILSEKNDRKDWARFIRTGLVDIK